MIIFLIDFLWCSCGILAYVYSENQSILLASLFLLLILAESKGIIYIGESLEINFSMHNFIYLPLFADLENFLASVIGSRHMQGLMVHVKSNAHSFNFC